MATATGTRTGRAATADRRRRALSWSLRLLTIAGLAVDGWVHADLVDRYRLNAAPGGLSQGDLFRAVAVASALAAMLLLLSGRAPVWLLAWLVAASGLAGLLFYRFYDPGAIGPLPDMYEPRWYPEKTLAGIAEAVALAGATLGWVLRPRR